MLLTHSVKKIVFLLLLPMALLGCDKQEQLTAQSVIQKDPAIHVDTLMLSATTLRLTNELPGRISAYKEAEVRPQVSGIVQSREFAEGSLVKRGQILYKIDATTYQATVNSAKAQLDKAIANQESTNKIAIRYAELLRKNLASQQLYDESYSTYLQAKAEVAIRKADLENASIQLSYTDIKAPISGRIGISQVNEGTLLTTGQASYLTTIIQLDQVYVDMKQSSVSLYKLRQEFKKEIKDRPPVPVTVTLEDGTQYNELGYLEFADFQVDNATGSVTLRALMPNPENILLPGTFVRAHIALPTEKSYLVIPQSAVIRSQSGEPSVFLVSGNDLAIKKVIVLGHEVNNAWVVKQGLVAGDQVIINNLIKVKNNQKVIVDSKMGAASNADTAVTAMSKD
ncbi:efflux RND transporter periplasmic adaptor subunit [Colwellia ponticola]|uniref:efflux RND transporter periplasmic adaptor subunit n=1 Tax=Colwellia ponticola TaxID=2304625 RepID=UPI001656C660|nr:efflux RND transporter periplasmic adaptor subunit [Colwellia ponticola]